MSLPARPALSLSRSPSLSRSGCFVGGPARGPARPPAPRRSGAAHSLSAGGRFQTAAIAAPLFAGRAGPAPLCARRPRLAGAGRSAAVTAREAHSSVHLGVGLRILLATREISPFSPCLQYGYKSGIFYYFFFTKLGLLFFFFCSTFSSLFSPSLLCCCFLISSTLNFLKGVHYNRFCSLFSFFSPLVCVCVAAAAGRPVFIPTQRSLFPLLLDLLSFFVE